MLFSSKPEQKDGFTLIELLSVVLIIAVLAAIAAPFGLRFLGRYKTTVVRDEAFVAIRQTQDKAQQEKRVWQFAIRQTADITEWTSSPGTFISSSAVWKEIGDSSIKIDAETTFAMSDGIYYVRFDDSGNVQYRLGRLTFHSRYAPDIKRCVVVSTLIGAMRKAEEQPVPDSDNKFCY